MPNMRESSRILDVEVSRSIEERKLIISQGGYARDVLEKCDMLDCSATKLPDSGTELSVD